MVYVRSGNLVKEIEFKKKDFDDAIAFVNLIFDLETGFRVVEDKMVIL